jgi:hypothetical protein
MGEYFREKNHQICDTELCIIIDSVTGKTQDNYGHAIMTIDEGIDYLRQRLPSTRYIAIKLNCIKAFELE